jgi:DNA-directed RNA polymerase subunit alpha
MSNFQFECIELNLQTSTEYFGRFVLKPLDVGHGITIGNILRRVLLTNLPGISIVGVRIAGVNHEFSTIPGVREDILEILLNLKEIIFKSSNSSQGENFGRLKVQGPAIITASSFNLPSNIEIINPNQYVATISDNSVLEMEIKLDWGKGYALAENQAVQGPLDFLKIDAIFMPVKKVVYHIETSFSERLGTQEQLILDIWTNGSITPSDAVSTASKTIINWFQTIENLDVNTSKKDNSIKQRDIKTIAIEELNLSARAYNGLKRAQINLIGELLNYSLNDLREIKNFGQKSVQEVLESLKTRYGVLLK